MPLTQIPVINRVAAGHAAEHTNLDYPPGVSDAYVPLPLDAVRSAKENAGEQSGALFATAVQGDSMNPEYREGEIIVVCDSPARDGDDCLIRLDESENFAQTLKRIQYVGEPDLEPTALRLIPLNPAYPERTVPLDRVTALYPVLYKISKPTRGPDRPPPLNVGGTAVDFDSQLGNSISG